MRSMVTAEASEPARRFGVALVRLPGISTGGWRFITNHAAVLLCVARQPTLRVRAIAAEVSISERATLKILNDLIVEGYVCRRRESRYNVYEVHPEAPLRHPVWGGGPSVGWLLRLDSTTGRATPSFHPGVDGAPTAPDSGETRP